jgi:alpha-tubulin suppressor-like RCC1 family protein
LSLTPTLTFSLYLFLKNKTEDQEVLSIGATGLGQVGTEMCGSEELSIEEIVRIEKGGLFEKKRKDKSKQILKIKSGYDHNLALWNDGALYVWGSNG